MPLSTLFTKNIRTRVIEQIRNTPKYEYWCFPLIFCDRSIWNQLSKAELQDEIDKIERQESIRINQITSELRNQERDHDRLIRQMREIVGDAELSDRIENLVRGLRVCPEDEAENYYDAEEDDEEDDDDDDDDN